MTAARENTAVNVGERAESDEEAKLQMLKGKLVVTLAFILAATVSRLCCLFGFFAVFISEVTAMSTSTPLFPFTHQTPLRNLRFYVSLIIENPKHAENTKYDCC